MKVRILDGTYSFKNEVIGKVFEAEPVCQAGDRNIAAYRVFIHFEHGTVDGGGHYMERAWNFPPSCVEIVPNDTPLSGKDPLPVALFEVGQTVVLRHNSKQIIRNGSLWNPVNMHGVIDGAELKDGEFYYHVLWSNGIRNNYDAEDLALVKPSKNAPRRKRGKVQKRTQTIVHVLYKDGTDYEIRRAKHVVINQEHKSLNVDTESVSKGGLVIRHNTSIPFAAIDCMRVSTKDGEFCYYLIDGEVVSSTREYSAQTKFKTQMH